MHVCSIVITSSPPKLQQMCCVIGSSGGVSPCRICRGQQGTHTVRVQVLANTIIRHICCVASWSTAVGRLECLGGRVNNPLLSVLIGESAAHRRWGGGGGGEGTRGGGEGCRCRRCRIEGGARGAYSRALDVCTHVQSSGPLTLILFSSRAGWNIACRR